MNRYLPLYLNFFHLEIFILDFSALEFLVELAFELEEAYLPK